MISIKQMSLLAVLAGGMAVVWIPELRGILPSFLTGESQASPSPAVGKIAVATDSVLIPEGPVSPASTGSAETSAPASSDQWNSVLRNFQTSQPVARVVGASEPGGVAATGESPTVLAWQNQLQAKPLSAILLSPKGHRALFGGQSFHEGQELLPGLSIQSIEATCVSLSDGQQEFRISLPTMGARSFQGASPFQLPSQLSDEIQ